MNNSFGRIETFHFDPYHKMRFGWGEPRIVNLTVAGTIALKAADSSDPAAPVILYDPAKGAHDYCMLEYRTPTGGDGRYDADVAGEGLVVWQVATDASHQPVLVKGTNASHPTWMDPAVFALGAPSFARPAVSARSAGRTARRHACPAGRACRPAPMA